MAMTTAKFRADGPPITVTIRCGFADPGAYELFLWEADRNSRQELGAGNFINADDDTFSLSSDAGQTGKILQCVATVNPLDNNGQFGVSMIVAQGGDQLANEVVSSTSNLPSVTVALFVQLEG
ncbi:MAG TPA: hypothetical protein VJT67_10445 [Longimicrobiaceae bacterium]|nr:hypothetical protein [Longimicrobiaceae bacterium]